MKTEVILSALEAKHPGEKEYLQAVKKFFFQLKKCTTSIPNSRKLKSSNDWLNRNVFSPSVCLG